MNILVHTGNKKGPVTPIVKAVDISVSPFNAETVGKLVAEMKNLRNPLTPNTEMKSWYEEVFKNSLLKLRINADYEPFSLLVGRHLRRDITYTPDFVTDLEIKGRRVIVEPHGMQFQSLKKIDRMMAKLKFFRNGYKNHFYLIMASDLAYECLKLRSISDPREVIDEYWETNSDKASTESDVTNRLHELLRRIGAAATSK